jgi:hypothetical protein
MKILKVSTPFITSPLTYMCNKSLLSCIFPSRLKFSEVKHLHKKGDKTDITNFRPISLLTSFSKILEKVVYTWLYQHIKQNNILATEQYSFRNNSSTERTSFKLKIAILLAALNGTLTVGGIFCDLEKAFDSVNPDILLSKCEFYGFRGKTNALLQSYLSDRYQRILIKNSSSSNTTIISYHIIYHIISYHIISHRIISFIFLP